MMLLQKTYYGISTQVCVAFVGTASHILSVISDVPNSSPSPEGNAFALANTVTSLVPMLNLLPDTIAVAFALAVALPRATSKPLPVTDKLHLPIIVTLPVPILNLLDVIVGLAPAFAITVSVT